LADKGRLITGPGECLAEKELARRKKLRQAEAYL